MREKLCGIYKITNLESGKVYVGSSLDIYTRFTKHKSDLIRNKHKNIYLQNAWNKYGSQNFIFEIIELVSPVDQLLIRESYWIKHIKCLNRIFGYNLSDIESTGIIKLSKETRQKMSKSKTGKIHTKESKKKMRLAKLGNTPWNKGISFSKEVKKCYEFIDPTGEYKNIIGIKQYCIDNNLVLQYMCKFLNGSLKKYKGYKRI